ncbi:hypothetical protein BD769DRAFT_1429910 [Suillus cothurnatus]|nr:hypothetical protein BD769DRAFT_1429910 [Suillus cothurnatus]
MRLYTIDSLVLGCLLLMIDLGLHVPCHSCFKINHVHRGLRTSHFDQAFISFVATAILRGRSPLPGFIAELRLQGVMKKDSSACQLCTHSLALRQPWDLSGVSWAPARLGHSVTVSRTRL